MQQLHGKPQFELTNKPFRSVTAPPGTQQNSQTVALPKAKQMIHLRATENELKYLSEQQIEALFRVIKSPRDRAMFRLMYHRGLRASEPGLLDLGDWHDEDASLYVRRLKGSKSARYPLLPAEAHTMRAWIRARGTAPGPLFPSRNHGGMERTQVWRLMRDYCRRAGLPVGVGHPHALKHSCGRHLVQMETPIIVVQEWLGHKSIQNTMIYVGADAAVQQASSKLQKWGSQKPRRAA
jgi:type 1 fimbriae regulatory protein FimB